MNRWLKSISNAQILSLFLVLFFLVEAINKIESYFGEELLLQKGVKLIALIAVLTLLFIQQKKQLVWLFVFSVSFAIGQYFLGTTAYSWDALMAFSRYFFFLSLILLPFSSDEKGIKTLCKLFEHLIVINSVLIVIAALFQIEMFKSYSGSRLGYNGLFMASSNSTYFYVLALMYYLGVYGKSVFKKWTWWLTVLAACYLGTKSVFLSLLFFGVITAFFFSKKKIQKLSISLGMAMLGAVATIVFFSTGLFKNILEKDGWISAILSHRDELLLEKSLPFIQENWRIVNYFFGGINHPSFRPQLAYIDLFMFFGILGSTLFLFLFFYNYFKEYRPDHFMLCCFLVLLATTCIAGNFFYNASVPIYLIVLKYALKNQNLISKSK